MRLGVEMNGLLDRTRRVIRQRGRNFQRHPAIHTGGCVVDRPKEIGGLSQVLDRQFEEEGFTRLAFLPFLADSIVVEGRIPDRVIKDRRIRRKTCNREIIDVAA